MKQTIGSKDPTVSLKTTGPIVGVGTYRDFVFRHKAEETVTFHLRYRYPKMPKPKEELERIGAYAPGQLEIKFGRRPTPPEIELRQLRIRDTYGRSYLTRSLMASGNYSLQFSEKLPTRYAKALVAVKPEHFLFPVFEPLFEIVTEEQRKRRRKRRRKRSASTKGEGFTLPGSANDYLRVSLAVESEVSRLLSHLSYLGPLRDFPKRFYESPEEIPNSVGSRGEYAPQILFLKRDPAFVRNVRKWVQVFGLGDRIRSKPLHRGIFSLEVVPSKKGARVDFAHAGFGLSQLLPLIVQSFHMETGETLFVEQPEIHLNPRLQCSLANLFSTMVKAEKTVIIETHSEHFVLRVRSLIARKELKPEDVALYFVEKSGAESTVRRIPIGEDGHIEPSEWPKGFFEDSIGEALSLARVQAASGTK